MKDIIIGIDEFTDSRELMLAKPKPFALWFIYIVLGIIAAFFIWAHFSQIEEYVSVSGTVQPTAQVSDIKFPINGTIKTVNVKDGQLVKSGDVLFEINTDSSKQQLSVEQDQLNSILSQIDNTTKLVNSVETDKNLFDTNSAAQLSYVAEFNDYQANVETTEIQYDNNAIDNTQIKSDAIQTLSSANQSISNYTNSLSDYNTLYNSISTDTNGFKNTSSIGAQKYLAYQAEKRILTQTLLNDKQELNTAKASQNSGSVTQATIDVMQNTVNSDQNNITSLKQNALSDAQSSIDQLKSELNDLELTKTKTQDALNDSNSKSAGETEALAKLKLDTISQFYSNLTTLQQNEATLKEQIFELQDTINSSIVKSDVAGIVSMISDIRSGDLSVAGNDALSLVPQTISDEVILYVPENDISHFNLGGTVKYQINSLPYSEYGEATGKVLSISPDAVTDNQTGKSYYVVKSSMDNKALKSDKGESEQIKSGMACQAKMIYGTKSILTWLFEKMDFWN